MGQNGPALDGVLVARLSSMPHGRGERLHRAYREMDPQPSERGEERMALMPGRSGARGRKAGAASQVGTLTDSFPRVPAARPDASDPRRRSPRRGEEEDFTPPGRLTLPSMPIATPRDAWEAEELPDGYGDGRYQEPYDEGYDVPYGERDAEDWAEQYGARDRIADDEYATRGYSSPLARPLARPLSRPLAPALPEVNYREEADPRLSLYPALPQASVPELVAYRPPRPRVRRATERLVQTARNPWTVARLILALAAAIIGFLHAPAYMGEPSQPLQVAQAQMGLSPGAAITSLVKPETQLKRPDLYDNYAQYQRWGGAACSAAAISEILTAYGVRDATIGHEIDELGKYIDPNWGLLNRHAFAMIAAKHGLRADESNSWTYNQIVYVSEHLGIPVIVNVRISYGYYSFFSGGHFLVVVGGDAQGLAIVDSSEYYIHYLPKSVFYQMFTGYTAAIAPADDHYNLPSN